MMNKNKSWVSLLIEDARWREPITPGDIGHYVVSVTVPDAEEDDEKYEAYSDEVIAELQAELPGWIVEWTGESGGDGHGDITEDISLTPPEGEDPDLIEQRQATTWIGDEKGNA